MVARIKLVPKAERNKRLRRRPVSGLQARETERGDRPVMKIPIRMRGYYRAVKRGEEWAMRIERKGRGTLNWFFSLAYRHVTPELFEAAIPRWRPKELEGDIYKIPVVLDYKNGIK